MVILGLQRLIGVQGEHRLKKTSMGINEKAKLQGKQPRFAEWLVLAVFEDHPYFQVCRFAGSNLVKSICYWQCSWWLFAADVHNLRVLFGHPGELEGIGYQQEAQRKRRKEREEVREGKRFSKTSLEVSCRLSSHEGRGNNEEDSSILLLIGLSISTNTMVRHFIWVPN